MRTALAAAAVFAAVSTALSFGFACAAPLAAFGAIAALTLPRAAGIAAVLAAWAAMEAVGYGALHYPTDAASFEWGAGLGAIALASLAAARATIGFSVARIAAGFAAAFVAYEGGVFVGCELSGGCGGAFAPAVVLRVLEINAASFVVMLAGVAVMRGAAPRPAGALAPDPLREVQCRSMTRSLGG